MLGLAIAWLAARTTPVARHACVIALAGWLLWDGWRRVRDGLPFAEQPDEVPAQRGQG